MKIKIAVLLSVAAALVPQLASADIVVAQGEDAELSIGGRTQALAFGQQVKDPYVDNNRLYLFMKEARFRAAGRYQDFIFNFEMALGGEESIVANSGVSLSLLDLSVNIPVKALGSYIKVGQFKVPYGRERLTYSADSQFIDRSVQDLGFRVGRDVGLAWVFQPGGKFSFIGGVFTGGGRDVPPQRYLPERLGVPQVVARAGWGDVDEDLFALKNDLQPKSLKTAFFVNGLYTKDSMIGHSSVLNVKFADKSLLLNSNWNPYLAQAPLDAGTWWQMGADAALRAPIGRASLSAEAEVNWAGYSNTYGVLHTAGGRAQAGIGFQPFEVAIRYSVLVPDQNFRSGSTQITGKDPIHEITPSAAWYISGQKLKLVADLPILVKTPVVTEKNVGSYVTTELPDQTSVLAKGGTVGRQNVVEGRLMLQAAF